MGWKYQKRLEILGMQNWSNRHTKSNKPPLSIPKQYMQAEQFIPNRLLGYVNMDYLGEFFIGNSEFFLHTVHYLCSSLTFTDDQQKGISKILNLLLVTTTVSPDWIRIS